MKNLLCEKVCGVVLAGGNARRMGEDKPFIQLGDKMLIERAAESLATVFREVFIVIDAASSSVERFNALPYHILSDRVTGLGPIGGIETALQSVPDKDIFVVAADMPFINSEVIKAMLALADSYDLVIPSLSGRLHPLHALYTQNCLAAIREGIEAKHLALHLLVAQVNSTLFSETVFRNADPFLHSLVNINTPDDLVAARLLLKQQK